jgi:FtsH-binding integral membrane protein
MNLSLTHFNMITPFVLLLTYFSAFKNGKVTCDNYLRNTFLYILSIYCIFITSMSYEKENNVNRGLFSIAGVIGIIGLIIFMYYTKNILLKHLCLLFIVIYIGITSYRFISRFDLELIQQTIIRVLIALTLCILFVSRYGHLLKDKGYKYLLFFLCLLILVYLIDVFFISQEHDIMYSYVFIGLFIGFLLYDIKFILRRKADCNSSNVDYIESSFDIFLDTLNLFKHGLLIADN